MATRKASAKKVARRTPARKAPSKKAVGRKAPAKKAAASRSTAAALSAPAATTVTVVTEAATPVVAEGFAAEAPRKAPPGGPTLDQKLVAEFVGTFALIFVGAGSIIAASVAGGGSSGAGLITIALAHGLVIATMVSAVGHISGGHFNPAVTIGIWVTGRIPFTEAAAYVVTQCAGAIAAAGLLRGLIPDWAAVKLGTPLTNTQAGIGDMRGIAIEAVLTFFLVWVIFATAVDKEGSFNKIAGLAIGLVITLDICMGGPFTGAAMNPARSLGPALVGGYWDNWYVYWVGPIAGGAAAALAYHWVVLRDRN